MNETTHAPNGRLAEPHRNNYFYGKLLDVGHLEMEQRYFNRKRWLVNRLAVGCGVLCGLHVTEEDGRLIVAPGAAIDGLGREIVVPHSIDLDAWHGVDADGIERDWQPGRKRTVYVCLEYRECLADFEPALVSECGSVPRGMPGTVVESYGVRLHAAPPEPDDLGEALCKALSGGANPGEKRDALCNVVIDQECSPTHDPCVVLATVVLGGDGSDERRVEVHPCEERSVLYSNERLLDLVLCLASARSSSPAPGGAELTTIARMSWKHDGVVALRDFPETLSVMFSSEKIAATTEHGQAWFVVTLETPPGDEKRPTIERTGETGGAAAAGNFSTIALLNGTVELKGNTAQFIGNKTFIDRVRQLPANTRGSARLLCRVVVKCDFLLDGSGKAVDGNHLGGKLPTGDGVPGGDFESWFFVTA